MDLAPKGQNSFSLCRPYRALGQSAAKPRAHAPGYYLSPLQGSGGVVARNEDERWADETVSKAIVVIRPDSAPEVSPTFCRPRSCLQAKSSEVLRESRPGHFLPPFRAPEVSWPGLKVRGGPMSLCQKAIVVIGPDSAPEVPPTFCALRSCLQSSCRVFFGGQ